MQKDTLFFASLLSVTLVPLIVVPLATTDDVQFPGYSTLIALTGAGHIACTTLVLRHRRLGTLMRENQTRLYWIPVAMVVLFAGLQFLNGVAWGVAIIVFFSWQLHHYQRQNYGIISFAAANGGIRVPAGVNFALHMATLAGILGCYSHGFIVNGVEQVQVRV